MKKQTGFYSLFLIPTFISLLILNVSCQPQYYGKAPSFQLERLGGGYLSLKQFKGRVVLINFWATWCAPCKEELPMLKAMHKNYKDKGFEIIGISLDKSLHRLQSYVKIEEIPYPIALGNDLIQRIYQLKGVPESFLVNEDGFIVNEYIGPPRAKDLEADILKLLKK